jgi:hypothetical protein
MNEFSKTLSDGEMFRIIMEDIRRLRERLDDNEKDHQSILDEMSKMRVQSEGERVKMGGITAGISLVVAGVVTWILSHLYK